MRFPLDLASFHTIVVGLMHNLTGATPRIHECFASARNELDCLSASEGCCVGGVRD